MRRSVAGPILLVMIGILLLLNNFGVVPWGVWPALLRFWPVILIVVGLGIAFSYRTGESRNWIGWLVAGAVALLIGLAVAFPARLERAVGSNMVDEQFVTSAEENRASRAEVEIEAGSARLEVAGGGTAAFSANAHYDRSRGAYELVRSLSGDLLRVQYRRQPGNFGWRWGGFEPERHQVTLGRIPAALRVSLGSGDAVIRPAMTPLTDLRLDVGSGSIQADFVEGTPEGCRLVRAETGSGSLRMSGFGRLGAGEVDVHIGSGQARLESGPLAAVSGRIRLEIGSGTSYVVLPVGTAYSLKGDIGSGSVSVGGKRYRSEDFEHGPIQSEGYAGAGQRIELVIELGSGTVNISFE